MQYLIILLSAMFLLRMIAVPYYQAYRRRQKLELRRQRRMAEQGWI